MGNNLNSGKYVLWYRCFVLIIFCNIFLTSLFELQYLGNASPPSFNLWLKISQRMAVGIGAITEIFTLGYITKFFWNQNKFTRVKAVMVENADAKIKSKLKRAILPLLCHVSFF
jgi:hypothetical protein